MSSAYTALVSLRQILVTIVYLQPRFDIYNRPQLQNLLEDVDLLLDFLEISSNYEASQVAEVERKMRDAAHETEHLINGGILTGSNDAVPLSVLFFVFTHLPARLGVIPVWIPVEAVICIINAATLYLRFREMYGIPTKNASHKWRRLFHDFRIIVDEVNQMKESSSSSSSSSALISLRQILGSITRDDDSGYLKSLQEKVTFLLENNAGSSVCTQDLDAKIREAVYKAKRALVQFQLPRKSGLILEWIRFSTLLDVLSLISPLSYTMSWKIGNYGNMFPGEMMLTRLGRQMCIDFASCICSAAIMLAVLLVQYNHEAPENQELRHTVNDFDVIVIEVIKIKDGCGEGADLSTAAAAASSSRQDPGNGRDAVVGLESDMEDMKARLFQVSSKKLELVSIVGMGGIGKTTLARQVYHDPAIKAHFDVRAWTMISQGNTLRHVLLSLLDSANMLPEEEKRQDSDQELGVHLHKYLSGRRYLIVVDDVWDTKIWDFLRRHFPENYNHSRVILTSRLPNVVSRLGSSSRLHRMRCLNENHSWDLLCTEVFGVVEGCPLELESIGKKIAKRCGGLPLAIVVIGGLLYKDIRIPMWRDVAEKLEKSELQDIEEQCLDILSLSYSHLPRHLKPCFLYTGLFLAHCEIHISTLIHLWIAEGFLRSTESKTLEEEAEGYVKDLIDRNLISVSTWSCDGKIRRCSMHDLLRDVCVENDRKEKFRHFVQSGGYVVSREGPDEPPRGLSIDPNARQVDHINSYLDFVHLRVVNVLGAKIDEFPRRIAQLVNLRYLALPYDGSVPLPPYIYKLQYLETLVLHPSSFGKYSFLPSSIWRMPNLRHIYVKPGCYMLKPLGHQLFSNYSVLISLQTLVGIRNFKWTRGIIEKLPNLKKLGILYDFSSSANWSTYGLENLVYLEKLEGLKITVKYNDDVGPAISHDPRKLAFPLKLKKLSLSGCRIPWESMTAIGALPNLEALKLRHEAFCGREWKTVEGQFPKLIFLLLEEMSFTRWETEESHHFPRLQRLVLRSCAMLEEIPLSIGDIPTLELIHLVDCRDSAVASAEDIQEEQKSMGNDDLKFLIEQRREVDGRNLGNLEARGAGPGIVEVVYDAFISTRVDMLVAVIPVVGILSLLMLVISNYCFESSRLGPSSPRLGTRRHPTDPTNAKSGRHPTDPTNVKSA